MYYHLIQKVVPFVLTFSLSVLLALTLQSFFKHEPPAVESPPPVTGTGSAYGTGCRGAVTHGEPRGETAPFRITFQPNATYTDAARHNNVQGAVRLKIALLADGTVGTITPVTELPDGLTDRAIAAARQIKFEPKRVNGQSVDVVITREYTFTIY